ncbi:hypothetical protein Tco_0727791 [Tanacetum coccineum]|uniref:Reverse transcriptase domain-containing protein n=1 Tax=Tanacetum coccineum TaxID=301880 RepID=A0ABQ4YJY0_9ASTR
MVRCSAEDRKRKSIMMDEDWMNVSITFPPVLARDLSEEAIMVEAKIEGYLVQRIHVDEGTSIEIMRVGKKQAVEPTKEMKPQEKISLTEEALVNPAHPDQLVAVEETVFSSEKSQVITKDVVEWLKAGIVRPVKYPTWISNPVLVKKGDGSWRMCIDFKNINSACPKDYYPLPEIDLKIESVMGFHFKCFLDEYKGYHQVQMAEEDEEKTDFYTD